MHFIEGPYRWFKLICFWTGFCVITLGFIFGIYLYQFYRSLPSFGHDDFNRVREQAKAEVFRRLEDKSKFKDYKWVDISHVSRDFIYTIVMSEDSSFFEHRGVDYDAIVNSMAENIRKKKYEYGASTISQQVVKNLYLSNEKSIIRKLKELLITESLEKHFSKNQILEIYLNIAELGPDIYGIGDAARVFFSKSPSDINAAEGAFIALMLPSPRKNYYAIYQNKNMAPTKSRKIRRVLGDMLATELISPIQYRKYIQYNFFGKPGRQLARNSKR